LTGDLPALRSELIKIASAELEGVDLRPKIDIDAEVRLAELDRDTYNTIQKMAPFGQGNPVPVFMTKGVEVSTFDTMGADKSHLRMKLRQGKMLFDAVGFGLGSYAGQIGSNIDLVYNLELDTWNGNSKLRLNILDFQSGNAS
jgi:single-stranded-DNA-specific exonuclease